MWNKLDIFNHVFIFLYKKTTLKIKKSYLFFLTLKFLQEEFSNSIWNTFQKFKRAQTKISQ